MASEGLTDRQLKWLMGRDARFLGVFSSDQLPPLQDVRRPSGLIVNSDPAHKPGTHWLAIHYGKDGKDEFFDSYGKSPTSYVKSWEEHLNPRYRYNRRILQGDETTVCGHYCVFYLKQKNLGRTMESVVKCFPGPKSVNDKKICHWVCRNPQLLKRLKAQDYCQSSVCGRARRCC